MTTMSETARNKLRVDLMNQAEAVLKESPPRNEGPTWQSESSTQRMIERLERHAQRTTLAADRAAMSGRSNEAHEFRRIADTCLEIASCLNHVRLEDAAANFDLALRTNDEAWRDEIALEVGRMPAENIVHFCSLLARKSSPLPDKMEPAIIALDTLRKRIRDSEPPPYRC